MGLQIGDLVSVDGSSGRFDTGTVTQAPAGGMVGVNVNGSTEQAVCPPDFSVLIVGDSVLTAKQGGTRWVIACLATNRRTTVDATVTSVGTGTVTVTNGTDTWPVPALTSYPSPAVGHAVWISIQNGSMVAVGRRTQPLASTDPGASYTPTVPPTPPPSAPSAPTPDAPKQTGSQKFAATQAGTWQGGSWRTDTVLQWYWSSYPVEGRGAWFYGTTPTSTLRGRTVTRFRVRLVRSAGGTFGGQPAHVYLTSNRVMPGGDVTRTAGPSDVTLDIGQGGWFDLPAGWGQTIIDSGGGLAIYGSPYVKMPGLGEDAASGQIQIDWRR